VPIYIGDYGAHLNEWEKAAEGNSQLLVNCLASIDSSLWLIAGGRIPQALVMLHNSVEVAFKAELERIHPVLISDSKLDYNALKSLLKDAFHSHPRGQQMNIPDYDMERTITFVEAMNRVSELYPSVNSWKAKLKHAQSLRNNIVHYGSRPQEAGRYADSIVTTLFPFLQAFLQEASGIDLGNIVTQPVYRELQVAKRVCERLLQENQSIGIYVLTTVRLTMLHIYVDWPSLSDITGVDDREDEFQMAAAMKIKVEREWADGYIERSCRICSSASLFVKVEPVIEPQHSLLVLAAKCSHCGLDINEKYRYLAEYHIGEPSQEEIETFMRDIGELE
jgi:hypothetical protein